MRRVAAEALLSHWLRHPLQLLTLVAGLALATALWSAVQAINAEARASYDRAAQQIGVGTLPELRSPSGFIPVAQYVDLRRAGWLVAPILDGRTRLGGDVFDILGVDLLNPPPLPALDSDRASPVPVVDMMTPPGRLLGRSDTLSRLSGLSGLPPLLSTDAVPPGLLVTDMPTAARLLGIGASLTRLLVLPDQAPGLESLDRIAPDLVLRQPASAPEVDRLTSSFHLNLTAFGLLSFAVGLFIVHGAIGLAFEQRRPTFRTLRALGLPLRVLMVLLAGELLIFAVVSGLVGLGLGHVVAAALLPDVAATLRGLYGAPVEGGLTVRPGWIAAGLGMAVAGTMTAGAQAFVRMAQMPLLAVSGARAWALRSIQADKVQATVGLGLGALGGLCLLLFDGLLAGFAMLAGLMLGAALLLPPVLGLVLRWAARRARRPVTEWVLADMVQQLPGLTLALMALLLALAANIGVGTMVSSFRSTFAGWLDQRLASELYVTVASDAQGRDLETWLRGRAEAVLPIRSIDLAVGDTPVTLYGIADHPTYRDHWPLIAAVPDVWDRLAQGGTVLINEQLARRKGYWPGTDLALAPDWVVTVVGVYSDYGNPTGQAIVALPALLAQQPNVPNRRFGVRIAPEKAPALSDTIRAVFGLPDDAVIAQSGIKARSLAIFEKTFVVTGALNVLTLGVAGFAILTSMLTLWTRRLPQLAPVWALGLTRAQLAWLELWRGLGLAALTALFALPLGLLLAWILLAVINVEAFGWRLPMYLFPLDWLRLLTVSLVAAALASAIPVARLRRVPPSDLLKVFANDR